MIFMKLSKLKKYQLVQKIGRMISIGSLAIFFAGLILTVTKVKGGLIILIIGGSLILISLSVWQSFTYLHNKTVKSLIGQNYNAVSSQTFVLGETLEYINKTTDLFMVADSSIITSSLVERADELTIKLFDWLEVNQGDDLEIVSIFVDDVIKVIKDGEIGLVHRFVFK